MANELQLQLRSCLTLYTQAVTPTALYFNGSDVEAYDVSHWSLYTIALIEPVAGAGIYFGSMPTNLPPGLTLMPVFIQAGTEPTSTDCQYRAARGIHNLTVCVDWSGTAVNSIAPFGRWDGPSVISLPQSQTALAVNRASAILDTLYTARATLAAGNVVTTTVDGESVTFATPAQLENSILFWERKVALLTGQRKRVTRLNF